MNKINMHIHSIGSDGVLSGIEIVKLAQKKGLKIISITDHDSVSEVQSAIDYSKKTDVQVITGVELSADYPEGICHILGYGITISDNDFYKKIKKERIKKAKKIIEMLSTSGYKIDYQEVYKISPNNIIGRRDISKILVEHNYFSSEEDAMNQLLNNGRPFYIETKKPSIKECISFIKNNGGYAIIAHPWTLNLQLVELESFLIKNEFDGIEVYNHNISTSLYEQLENMANELNIYKTCGTDYHGNKGLNDFVVDKEVDCSKILKKIMREN